MLSKKQRLPIQIFVGKKGKVIKNPCFLIKIYDSDKEFSRFGVTISSKVAKRAVERNRLKRIVYNFIREYYKEMPIADYWISVLPPASKLEKENLRNELSKLLTTN